METASLNWSCPGTPLVQVVHRLHGVPLSDGTASSNGSELLYSYLGQRLQWGEMHYGPYIEMPANEVTQAAGGQKQ